MPRVGYNLSSRRPFIANVVHVSHRCGHHRCRMMNSSCVASDTSLVLLVLTRHHLHGLTSADRLFGSIHRQKHAANQLNILHPHYHRRTLANANAASSQLSLVLKPETLRTPMHQQQKGCPFYQNGQETGFNALDIVKLLTGMNTLPRPCERRKQATRSTPHHPWWPAAFQEFEEAFFRRVGLGRPHRRQLESRAPAVKNSPCK